MGIVRKKKHSGTLKEFWEAVDEDNQYGGTTTVSTTLSSGIAIAVNNQESAGFKGKTVILNYMDADCTDWLPPVVIALPHDAAEFIKNLL